MAVVSNHYFLKLALHPGSLAQLICSLVRSNLLANLLLRKR